MSTYKFKINGKDYEVAVNGIKGKNAAVYANINMLNDNMTNRKALGLGFNFSF